MMKIATATFAQVTLTRFGEFMKNTKSTC